MFCRSDLQLLQCTSVVCASAHHQDMYASKFLSHQVMLCMCQLCPHILGGFWCSIGGKFTSRSIKSTCVKKVNICLIPSACAPQVDAQSGNVTDHLVLEGDFVPLSHNSGLSACRDRLAVLGLRSQTIKLLQVLLPLYLSPPPHRPPPPAPQPGPPPKTRSLPPAASAQTLHSANKILW